MSEKTSGGAWRYRTLLLMLFLSTALLLPAGAARAEPSPGAATYLEEGIGAAEYFAQRLAAEPEDAAVIVSDALAGDYDLDALYADLHASFGRLDTPYYVIASPFPDSGSLGSDLLAAVQDRLGRPGLYVHLQPGGSLIHTLAQGVDLPVNEAESVALLSDEITYRTPLDDAARTYVDLLLDPEISERARDERERSAWRYGLGPISRVMDQVDGLRTGSHGAAADLGGAVAALTGLCVTLALLLHGRWPGRAHGPGKAGPTGPSRGPRARVAGQVLLYTVPVIVLAAALVYVRNAPSPEDEGPVGPVPPDSPPYVASTVRVDRVAEALREAPVYVDPLAAGGMEGLEAIAERAEEAPLPVRIAVVPMYLGDESGGEPEILAHALHHAMEEEGAFVVVSTSASNTPEVAAALFGYETADQDLRDVTGYQFDYTSSQALGRLMDVLEGADVSPGADAPVPYEVEYRTREVLEPSRLSQFFSEKFFSGLILVGPAIALAGGAAAAAVMWRIRRRRAVPGRRLRPMADRAARRAARTLGKATAGRPGLAGALREADTALVVLGGNPDELDLVGVVVLARRAVRLLNGDPEGTDAPVCMVNPLHGVSKGGYDTGLDWGKLPMCAFCASLPDSERRKHLLRVDGGAGKRVPHLDLNRFWTGTWYGGRGELDTEQLMGESNVH